MLWIQGRNRKLLIMQIQLKSVSCLYLLHYEYHQKTKERFKLYLKTIIWFKKLFRSLMNEWSSDLHFHLLCFTKCKRKFQPMFLVEWQFVHGNHRLAAGARVLENSTETFCGNQCGSTIKWLCMLLFVNCVLCVLLISTIYYKTVWVCTHYFS